MPKFLADEVKSKIDGIISGMKQPVSTDAAQAAQELVGKHFDEFKNELAKDIVKQVLDQLKGQDDGNSSSATSGTKKPVKGGSWLEALASAMGEQLGKKAGKMVELGDRIAKTAGGEGKQAAEENTKATMEMQATGQMFNLMQNAFSSAIKSIGEGLAQAARKG